MLKFSKANTKLKQLYKANSLKPWLKGKRKIYSYDSGLSGFSCPFAKDCMAKVHILDDGKKKLKDGPETKFRCFSASQEVLFSAVYNNRKANFDYLKSCGDKWGMARGIINSLPNDAGVIRINVAGDIFSQEYFDAIIIAANSCKSVLFYAYTKSLPYWVTRLGMIPNNLILTASYGGRYDNLITKHNLRSVKVVFSEKQAKTLGLEIDHTDEHACNPNTTTVDFGLLIHGVQPSNTEASKAISQLKANKVEFEYGKKSKTKLLNK